MSHQIRVIDSALEGSVGPLGPLQDDVTDDKGSDIQEARAILYRLFVRGHLQEVDDGISDVFSFFWSDSVAVAEDELLPHDRLGSCWVSHCSVRVCFMV